MQPEKNILCGDRIGGPLTVLLKHFKLALEVFLFFLYVHGYKLNWCKRKQLMKKRKREVEE